MFLFVFLLCCVLQPILHYYCVFGKRESLQRFVVEDGAKPAIFGSYSYDPVKQVFVPPPPDVNDTSKHKPPHSYTETQTKTETQTHRNTEKLTNIDTVTETQTNKDTGTQTNKDTESQTNKDKETQTHTSTDKQVDSQSLKDSFISTAGDSGTDSTTADGTRKRVPNNLPW